MKASKREKTRDPANKSIDFICRERVCHGKKTRIFNFSNDNINKRE